MKRTPPPARTVGISRTWPLIHWIRCETCGQEFRREWGWKRVQATLTPGGLGSRLVGAACGECAPTRNEAEAILGGELGPPPLLWLPDSRRVREGKP